MPSSQRLVRLFVALHPPEDVARRLLDAAAKVVDPLHRFSAIEQVHLTLLFIGDRPGRELRDVAESTERAAAGVRAFELTAQELLTLPEKPEPRLLAATTNLPSPLIELHRRLVLRLAKPAQRRDSSEILPHLTLCRFDQQISVAPIHSPLSGPTFPVHRISLIKSVLLRGGALHETVATVELG